MCYADAILSGNYCSLCAYFFGPAVRRHGRPELDEFLYFGVISVGPLWVRCCFFFIFPLSISFGAGECKGYYVTGPPPPEAQNKIEMGDAHATPGLSQTKL